jgi:hypothetical protein
MIAKLKPGRQPQSEQIDPALINCVFCLQTAFIDETDRWNFPLHNGLQESQRYFSPHHFVFVDRRSNREIIEGNGHKTLTSCFAPTGKCRAQ